MTGKRYPKYDIKYGSCFFTYDVAGAIRSVRQPRLTYLNDAIVWGAKHRDGTDRPIRIIGHSWQIQEGKTVEVSKPYVTGQILFTGERYLPHILENGPMLAIWHDKKLTYSRMILLYPNNEVVLDDYLRKFQRDAYLPKNRKL